MISSLSDQATTNLLEFAAWAEGESIEFLPSGSGQDVQMRDAIQDDYDVDAQIFHAANTGNLVMVEDWAKRICALPDARARITSVFLSISDEASEDILKVLLQTDLVDVHAIDEINNRNLLHKAALSGREFLLTAALERGVNIRSFDVYGRIPLHYACIKGFNQMVQALLTAGPDTINTRDHDNFTPLIHAIVNSQVPCIETLLAHNARIDPEEKSTEHVPLNLACQSGSFDVVQLLLRKQPSILPDAEGLYPQHLVARSSRDQRLILLLRGYGADLDQADKLYQWTPLFHAASEGNVEGIQTLLGCGVNSAALDEKGLSALYYAAWEGHLECMKLLSDMQRPPGRSSIRKVVRNGLPPTSTPLPMSKDADGIPDFTLPPPIIPVRRYGHNFLESKFLILLRLGSEGEPPIRFYDENRYPASRITISSKSSDLIPRNIPLPIQDDTKNLSFQIDNLESFSIEFDVYATFGAKIIARAIAASPVFKNSATSRDTIYLELLDGRLRGIGRIAFGFLVVKPFQGIPLEITHFSTYWKATRQSDGHPGALVAGSSLSGDYVRLPVQVTKDGVPVVYPTRTICINQDLDVPVGLMSYNAFRHYGAQQLGGPQALVSALEALSSTDSTDIKHIHLSSNHSYASLEAILKALPAYVHVELHVLFPRPFGLSEGGNGTLGHAVNSADINKFIDDILRAVFDHARQIRDQSDGFQRSIVFSSSTTDACTAINWKQPNCEYMVPAIVFRLLC